MLIIAPNGCTARFEQGDATHIVSRDQTFDAVIGSPPYLAARTYGIEADRAMAEWVSFMLACTREALRVSKGLVLWVVAGTTEKNVYQPGPEALLYKAWEAGIELWRPLIWHKVDEKGGGCGTPGSGGKQWFRCDWEYVLAFKRHGPLPWADPLFHCRPPKFKPGGAMRNRQKDGSRELQPFTNPTWANPGNVIRARVGGGHMGDDECHESEAPFPEKLAAQLIQATCPVGGTVFDPFSGSGTTVCEAVKWARNGVGCDLRESQVEIGGRRLHRRIEEERAVFASPIGGRREVSH